MIGTAAVTAASFLDWTTKISSMIKQQRDYLREVNEPLTKILQHAAPPNAEPAASETDSSTTPEN